MLLGESLPGGEPIVEGFLWRNDNSILFGKEKSGKSIIALQLAHCITTGEPFLGEFVVPTPLNVAYIQVEGKIHDTQDHIKKMNQVIPLEPSRFRAFYYPGVALDTEEGYRFITKEIDGWKRPEVIILDPLYMAMQGDMTLDKDARGMVYNVRRLMEYYNSTQLIIHHAHRTKYEQQSSRPINEGSDGIFGSFVWKAFVDQVFHMERSGKRRHKISCDVSRMAKALEAMDLEMVEPAPLFFRPRMEGMGAQRLSEILACLGADPTLTIREVVEKTGMSERWVQYQMSSLLMDGKVVAKRAPGMATLYGRVALHLT